MERTKRSLELKDEIDLHNIGWIVQRIGWAVLFLIILAAALGAFGTGWLSTTSVNDEKNKITFERFARFETPMILTIDATATHGNLKISIPQHYLGQFEVDQIMPAPVHQHISKGETVFTFATDKDAVIRFLLIPLVRGRLQTRLRINDSYFAVSHFIYP